MIVSQIVRVKFWKYNFLQGLEDLEVKKSIILDAQRFYDLFQKAILYL